LSAEKKSDLIWSRVIEDSTKGSFPTGAPFRFLLESMKPTVEYVSDELPSGRIKPIHAIGTVARITFDWDADAVSKFGYTGLFRGANHGLVRAASSSDFDMTKKANETSFNPGLGVKFFRSGVPSGNFVLLHLFDSWDTFNWFSYPMQNHLSFPQDPSDKTGVDHLATVTQWPTFVGLSDFAKYTEDGVEEKEVKFPFELIFVPNKALASTYKEKNIYLEEFEKIPTKTKLYDIYAVPSPLQSATYIGKMTTKSTFTTSKYGDGKLFIKHVTFEEDLKLRPEWLEAQCSDAKTCKVCPVDIDCGLPSVEEGSSIATPSEGAVRAEIM
jgi:hypothetical protein